MRRPVPALLAALLLLALPGRGLAQDARVLMVGNSYTASNDLPALVAAALQDTVPAFATIQAQGYSPGGATLAEHASAADGSAGDSTLRQLLVTGPDASTWDWVFLQDQSQVPGFPQNEPLWQASAAGAVTLDQIVVDGGGETVFLLTWGRRDGDAQNPTMYPDFPTMQQRLLDGYQAYAAAASADGSTAWIAPAGLAFARVHDDLVAAGQDPTEAGTLFHSLYTGDGSHPALPGSYLVALATAAALSGHSVDGAASPQGLDAKTAATLRAAAASVTVDDPFGEVAFRWSFEWAEWVTPGDVAVEGIVISDAVMRPVVRVAAPVTSSDAVTVAADHDGRPGTGRLWLEEPLEVQGPLTISTGGALELVLDEVGEMMVDAAGDVLLSGTTTVIIDEGLTLDATGTWDLVQAPDIDTTGGQFSAPDGFSLAVGPGAVGQVLQLSWGGGDDDDADDDGADDDSAGDDDSEPVPEDCGGCGDCQCRLDGSAVERIGALGPSLLLAWLLWTRRRR